MAAAMAAPVGVTYSPRAVVMCRFRCSAAAYVDDGFGTGTGNTPWAQRMVPVPS